MIAKIWVMLAFMLSTLVFATTSDATPKLTEPAATVKMIGEATHGGILRTEVSDDMSPAERQRIWGQIDANLSNLAFKKSASLIGTPSVSLTAPQILFSWPLRNNAGYKGASAFLISNFVDHDPLFPNHLKDFQCGTRTYDTASGYNHAGTDIALWPDSWNLMASGLVDIVAAASGTIVLRSDGNVDQSCKFNNNDWNAVYIQHDDGSIAWYGHMKKGSPTTKQVGDRVTAGEYLGKVGSSGNSTGPHLHFEIYDSSRKLIDPYAGQCNDYNVETWWAAQPAYEDPNLNRLYTASAPPVFSTCGADGTLSNGGNYFEKSIFSPGESAIFLSTYRDQTDAATTEAKVMKPDGTLAFQWSDKTNVPYYSSSYWYRTINFLANAPTGVWTYEAAYNGKTVRMPLTITPLPAVAKRGSTDVAGNNKGTILLRSPAGQLLSGALVNNAFQFSALPDPGSNYRLIAAGDFDNDDKTDLVYQDNTQAVFGDVRWRSAFQAANDKLFRTVKLAWVVQAVADLDGDGFADMVFRFTGDDGNPNDIGVSYVWFTDGNAVKQVRKRGGAPLNWTLLGAADINGDNAADMIYISPTGAIKALMATPDRTCANLNAGNVPAGFAALKLGDFSGNRLGDILLHNTATGQVQLLTLNAYGITLPTPTANPGDPNASCTASNIIIPTTTINQPSVDPTWRFYAAADLNGDGIMDIVWQQPNGTLTVWLMNQNGAAPSVAPIAGTAPAGFEVFQP